MFMLTKITVFFFKEKTYMKSSIPDFSKLSMEKLLKLNLDSRQNQYNIYTLPG